jgi:5-deoxy-D-glucuronate isomerase
MRECGAAMATAPRALRFADDPDHAWIAERDA